MNTDILIVGSGAAGLYAALRMPEDKKITVVTKKEAEMSDSFLAQGGICVLRGEDDYESFYEDTMRAGHYENTPESVDLMIRGSREAIEELVSIGVRFEKNGDDFVYTREGAHSKNRILFHEDETGKEITSHLLQEARRRKNITVTEGFTMVDIIVEKDECMGIIGHNANGEYESITADYTVLATGGIGGLYRHSTNYRHITGDALAIAVKHNIKLNHIDYIQIHPTTLFTHKDERVFLISESVRGEGAVLLNGKGERFVNELLPRDVVAEAIFAEMEKEGSEHVWLSLAPIPEEEIKTHFPHIYSRCMEEGYDVTKEPIPVVPAQHYFMGGIYADSFAKTTMPRLYAVGETACNGVHGKNRLASNSLLESLVFARRAADNIKENYKKIAAFPEIEIDEAEYAEYREKYKKTVLDEIEKEKNKNE